MKIVRFIKSLYLSSRVFIASGVIVFLFTLSYFVPRLFPLSQIFLLAFVSIIVAEIVLLYRGKVRLHAHRLAPEKLSNGDENRIAILVENRYPFAIRATVIDEVPHQFQYRNISFPLFMKSGTAKTIHYHLRPTRRGEYSFGRVIVYISSVLGFVQRRTDSPEDRMCPVYPSFIQMRKYELLAISNRLTLAGVKKIRKIGHNIEFDQIRGYVTGDDYRTVNWKATARKGGLMVNQFMDERAQPVYSLIDMGRVMKMPFNGLSLLDYSINASLVISNIALLKHDKAGVITFAHKVESVLPAERKPVQMHKILELLYRQKTGYLESNFEFLYSTIRRKINQRSLLLLFTNFESLSSMQRQLPYMRSIAKQHLLVVIFFRNTELHALLERKAVSTEDVYRKTIAEKFEYEKRLIVKELEAHGIHSILTAPEHLTVNTINKYLELKSRGMV